MKITGIKIEQFGPWNPLSLSLTADGVTVVSGANESGKSSLRRFVRGVLFGFAAADFSHREQPSCRWPSAGALLALHRGRALEIRRSARDGGRGCPSTRWLAPPESPRATQNLVEHLDWEIDDETLVELPPESERATLPWENSLAEILGDLSEALFDQVFSLGLRELHELATLSDSSVQRVVLGETLGPFGQTLLSAHDELAGHARRLWDDSRAESLPKLLTRYAQLDQRIQTQQQRVHRHAELLRERRQSAGRVAEMQSRRANVQDQLRGYTHIERVWAPWQRLRNLQSELARLPRIDDFPDGGVARFDQIEQDLRAALKCRDSLLDEAKQFHRDAKKLAVSRELRQSAATMRDLLDQHEHIGRLEERARQSHAALKQQREKLDQQIQSLGGDWSLSKLESLDTSVAANYRLSEKARHFRRAAGRHQRAKQRLLRLSQLCLQGQAEIDAALKTLNGLSLDEALRQAQRAATVSMPIARPLAPAIADDREAEHLRQRIDELEQRRVSLSQQMDLLESRLSLPTWVLCVLGFFAVGGVLLAMVGIATGFASNALAGVAYALLGTSCGGLALSLKLHFEQQARDSITPLREELRSNEAKLRDARKDFAHATGETSDGPPFPQVHDVLSSLAGPSVVPPPSRPFALSAAELQRLRELQQRIARWQRRRGPLNERCRAAIQELATARQAWCESLKQLNLPECVKVSETLELWQRIAAADEQRQRWRSSEADFQRHLEELQNARGRIVEILHRLNRRDLDARPTAEVFAVWRQDLQQLQTALRERLRLRRDERRRRAEAAEYREKIEDLRQQRSALLRQGCATDRDDYARRATIVARHAHLQLLLDSAREELEAATQAHPELAIVEDDLLRFDSSQHAATLSKLRRDAEQTDREIEQLRENLGRMAQEIERLETDDEPSEWRLERELLSTQIQSLTEQWLAAEWCSAALDGIRARYERICQPGILASASRCFARLTAGRFRTLWTPLRQRALRVDDATGQTHRLEDLSDSTRELLMLSIRLSMIEELGRRGIELPLMLDEVLLSLDPTRAAIAANEVIEFAGRGHQVLFFTSHPHLAELFTNAGCPVIQLNHHSTSAERLAG